MKMEIKFLEEAKLKQEQFERSVEFHRVRLEYNLPKIGMCSGTHVLSRSLSDSNLMCLAFRVEDVFLSTSDDETGRLNDHTGITPENVHAVRVLIKVTEISLNRSPGWTEEVQVRVKYVKENGRFSGRVVISPENFKMLLDAVRGSLKSLLVKSERVESAKVYALESDQAEDSCSRIQTLQKLGYRLIRVCNPSSLYHIIKWHPFVYGDHIMVSQESFKLLKEKYFDAIEAENNARKFIAAYGERYRPDTSRADAIKEVMDLVGKELCCGKN